MIVKNEETNLPGLLDSVSGCFDEIHITDTGSTDKTVEIASAGGCHVHSFKWVNDFSEARNFSFEQAKTDFIMWLDGDDVLTNKEAFIQWRDYAMGLCDYWLATYDYASDKKGNPIVSFARERVIKNGLGMKWKYFVHEGIPPIPGVTKAMQYITTWKVTHKRTVEDIQKDKFRNLKLFEANKDKIDARMRFYYGKEYFESNQPMQAFGHLLEAISDEKLELHDRTLGIQYASYALMQCNQFEQAINIAYKGLQLAPQRAEYHIIIGDCYLKMNKPLEAVPFYAAAKACRGVPLAGDVYAGPMFSHADAYQHYPRNQMARILYQVGDFQGAFDEAKQAFELYKHPESKQIMDEIGKAMAVTRIDSPCEEVDEIVISTPPAGAYEWDEEKYKTKGMGGSETAAIEISKHLKAITGKPVKIFNMRENSLVCESGVEYHSVKVLNEYFTKFKPKVHIAWRHNTKLTNAKTYLWCHDLVTQGVEVHKNFDKVLCLSNFHKNYVKAMQGVKDEDIILTRNGIDPLRFQDRPQKNENKIIFPSSPDRGLDRAIKIVELARQELPDLELHVFYGFDNLRKYGMSEMADRLEAMIETRPWVKYYGFTEQKELSRHMMESAIWLYPANFIESFCITAIESLAAGCYPIAREIGALQDTLKEASENKMASLLDLNCETEEEYKVWTKELVDSVKEKRWERVVVDPNKYSWESVAKEWTEWL